MLSIYLKHNLERDGEQDPDVLVSPDKAGDYAMENQVQRIDPVTRASRVPSAGATGTKTDG